MYLEVIIRSLYATVCLAGLLFLASNCKSWREKDQSVDSSLRSESTPEENMDKLCGTGPDESYFNLLVEKLKKARAEGSTTPDPAILGKGKEIIYRGGTWLGLTIPSENLLRVPRKCTSTYVTMIDDGVWTQKILLMGLSFVTSYDASIGADGTVSSIFEVYNNNPFGARSQRQTANRTVKWEHLKSTAANEKSYLIGFVTKDDDSRGYPYTYLLYRTVELMQSLHPGDRSLAKEFSDSIASAPKGTLTDIVFYEL